MSIGPTRFALFELKMVMPDGKEISLWFDGNGKVTRDNGTFEKPVANGFSLPHISCCPFATDTCISHCYVHILEANEQEVYDKYLLNKEAIETILLNPLYLDVAVDAFTGYVNKNCQGGFRWHISGDIFSNLYAIFIRRICDKTPDVSHWIYTRSYPFAHILVGTPNLVVNLSADKDNILIMTAIGSYYGLRVVYFTPEEAELPSNLPVGSVIFPDHSLRGRNLAKPTDAPFWQSLSPEQKRMICPADMFGQGPHIRCGPCKKCLK